MDQKQPKSESSSDQNQDILDIQNEVYITNARQFLTFSNQDKKIKVMDQCNPIFNHVYLKDISLHKKGPLQDKIYARVGKYYRNIRRGNTLCQIYHPDQNNNKEQIYDIFFCRRGMKKFYDLQPEYLKIGSNLSTHHRLMRRRIFEGLDQDLEIPGAQYHLYCLFKENGEHCQISYVKELNSWLFASKNVAILARDQTDLQQHYHKERFYWAKLIGDEFFKTLSRMTEQERENFKKDIDGFTLLGEHCGNQQHQHITKYDKVQIIFYGLVSNVGIDHCQPVEQCRNFLKKYGLQMSVCKERKGLVDKNKIFLNMWEMLRETAEGTMDKEGEGSVMYIVSERGQKSRTIGMCKLKTCEYLIYRRLREMLKLNVAKKGSTANNFEKYKFQIDNLVQHYFKPPRPLEFYYELGEKAFKECGSNNQIDATYLRYKFVEFMQKFEENKSKSNLLSSGSALKRILIVCLPRLSNNLQKFCKGKGYEVDYMYRAGKPLVKTTVHILYMIPRLPKQLEAGCVLIIPQYGEVQIKECIKLFQECKDLSRSHLITFVKSEDKSKNLMMLFDKIEGFKKSCKENKIQYVSVGSSQSELINIVGSLTEEKIIQKPLINQIYGKAPLKHFILPLLIPGSGKSTLSKNLLNNKSNFIWKIIDSDSIRRDCMDEIEKVSLNDDNLNKVFFQTKDQALKKYQEEFTKEIMTAPEKLECLFVDRIFSPFSVKKTIDELLSAEKDYIRIHVLTQTYNPTKLNDKVYPYSLNYLLTCLKRCLERTDHKTMPNNPYEVAKIVIKFYQMMANFGPNSILKRFESKVNIINLQLIEDSEHNSCVNQQLKKKVQECLNLVEPGHEVKDSSSLIELVESLYKFGQFKDSQDLQKYQNLCRIMEEEISNSN